MSQHIAACKMGDVLRAMGWVVESGALTSSGVNDNFKTEFWNEKGWLIDTS